MGFAKLPALSCAPTARTSTGRIPWHCGLRKKQKPTHVRPEPRRKSRRRPPRRKRSGWASLLPFPLRLRNAPPYPSGFPGRTPQPLPTVPPPQPPLPFRHRPRRPSPKSQRHLLRPIPSPSSHRPPRPHPLRPLHPHPLRSPFRRLQSLPRLPHLRFLFRRVLPLRFPPLLRPPFRRLCLQVRLLPLRFLFRLVLPLRFPPPQPLRLWKPPVPS